MIRTRRISTKVLYAAHAPPRRRMVPAPFIFEASKVSDRTAD
jgi:hypothetical protein